MENNYLIYSLMIVISIGIIISLIGNYQFKKVDFDNDLITCDKKILSQLEDTHGPNENAFMINYTGNMISFAGVLFLLLLSTVFAINKNDDSVQNIKNVIIKSLPIIFTLIIMSYLISLNNQFKHNIIFGRVANEFFSYSFLFSILLLVQIYILLSYYLIISKESISESDSKSMGQLSAIIYVIVFLNLIILGIINIILKFFSTDG